MLVGREVAVFGGVLFLTALVFPPIEKFAFHFFDAVFDNRGWVLDFVAFLVEFELLRFDSVVGVEAYVLKFLRAFLVPPLFKRFVDFFFLP